MSFDIRYRYFEVGNALVEELLLHLQRGESFVLLGCQGGGKRHALTLLGNRLDAEQRPHLSIFFKDNHPIITEGELMVALKKRLHHQGCEHIVGTLKDAPNLAAWFQRLSEKSRGRAIPASFANMDWIADSLKNYLLGLIRVSVQQGHIVAALSGESLLARALGGETSPFHCAYQFVLTGHDRATCRTFFLKRVHACQIKFYDPDDPSWNEETAFKALFGFTGGNVNLLRAILWSLSERRLRFDEQLNNHPGYTNQAVRQSFNDYTAMPVFGIKLFHAAKSLIEHNRDVLVRLEQLLDQFRAARDSGLDLQGACTAAFLEAEGDAPEPLELVGLLRRDPTNGRLSFSSLYEADFVFHYFSWTCRGDFHAKQGNWEKAFECYAKVECPEKLQRPIGELDFRIMRHIVNRLCREFAQAITQNDAIDRLRDLIAKSGKTLFGLKSTRIIQISDDGHWQLDGDERPLPSELEQRVEAVCQSEPMLSTRPNNYEDFAFYQDESRRLMIVQTKPGRPKRPELNPRHALVFEAEVEGPTFEGLRLRLLETVGANFLTCFADARLRNMMMDSRLRLGEALKNLFGKDTVPKSLEALGDYVYNEFAARGVRLFFIDIQTGDLKSAKSWGFKDPERQLSFDSGQLILKKGEDPELWAALTEEKPIAFRWHPKNEQIPPSTTDLRYRTVTENAYSDKVERQPGDYWIDFPLFVGGRPYGKLTLAFASQAPPPDRYMSDLGVISDILAHHLKGLELNEIKFAEMRSLQQRAIAITAHDLATRIASLPIFLADYRDLEELLTGDQRAEAKRINDRFQARLQTAMDVLERAKLRLAEVKPKYSEFDLVDVAREALRLIDPAKGIGTTRNQNPNSEKKVLIEGDKAHLSGVFLELVSDSLTMHNGSTLLCVEIQFTTQFKENRVVVDYTDNGPGVPEELKEKIFEYLISYRPGQKRHGLGLGLAYVRETIQAHGGTIREVGHFGSGVHFHIEIPIKP